MSESFRNMMRQAHNDGVRGRALRVAESLREISRAQVYHKTRDDLPWINVAQLAQWMGRIANVGPQGQRNFHSFITEYDSAFTTLMVHGFLNWGEHINGGWNHHNAEYKDPQYVLFQITPQGSQFLKQHPTDYEVIRSMGLWQGFVE